MKNTHLLLVTLLSTLLYALYTLNVLASNDNDTKDTSVPESPAGIIAKHFTNTLKGKRNQVQINITKNHIKIISAGLEMYKLSTGGFPTTEQGLKALIDGPFHGSYVKDPKYIQDYWSRDFVYRFPWNNNHDKYLLYSKGPNGVGDGYDEDDVKLTP